jgi:hypothetical protein
MLDSNPSRRRIPVAAIADRPMTKRNDVPVKLDAEVVRVAKIAAAYKDMSLAEYLSERLRPLVSQDVEQEHAKKPHMMSKGKGRKPAADRLKEGE